MSILSKTLLSLLVIGTSASPAPSVLSQRCTPYSTFSLQAVSPDPTINDLYVSMTGSPFFLNSSSSEITVFYKNDTTSLYAYVNTGNTNSDGGSIDELEAVYAFNQGFTYTGNPAGVSVYYGDYVASDVAFPNPMGTLTFTPEGDNGTALGGWWACPYDDSVGNFQTLANGAPGFPGYLDFGFGPDYCQEIQLQIKPIENVEC